MNTVSSPYGAIPRTITGIGMDLRSNGLQKRTTESDGDARHSHQVGPNNILHDLGIFELFGILAVAGCMINIGCAGCRKYCLIWAIKHRSTININLNHCKSSLMFETKSTPLKLSTPETLGRKWETQSSNKPWTLDQKMEPLHETSCGNRFYLSAL